MPPQPAVRARATLDLLDFLAEYRPGLQAQVRARMPPAALRKIENTSALDWISIEHTHFLVDSIVECVGPRAVPELWATFLQKRMIPSPVLRAFTASALRLFGATPAKLVAIVPHGWESTYRDFCKLRVVESGPSGALIALDDLAPAVLKHPNYFLVFDGVFRGMILWARGEEINVKIDIDAARCAGQVQLSWRDLSLEPRRSS